MSPPVEPRCCVHAANVKAAVATEFPASPTATSPSESARRQGTCLCASTFVSACQQQQCVAEEDLFQTALLELEDTLKRLAWMGLEVRQPPTHGSAIPTADFGLSTGKVDQLWLK